MSTHSPAHASGAPTSVRMRRRRPLPVALAVSMLAVIVVAAPVAAAGPYSLHAGDYGVHVLIDNQEYPGIRCTYSTENGALVRVRARRPIAFADDRNANVNSQWIRWRVDVRGGAFSTAVVGPAGIAPDSHVTYTPWQYDYTSDQVPAEFTSRTWYPSSIQRGAYPYFVFVIQIQWLYPYRDSLPPAGKAYHQVEWYEQPDGVSRWDDPVNGVCWSGLT